MSNEQITAFAAAVGESEPLQAKVQQLGDNLAGIVDLGRRQGYVFTGEELAEYMQSHQAESGRELTDEELEDVAGAGWTSKCSEGCGGV